MVFSEVWWVGSKEDNPTEAKLPLPQSLIEAGMKDGGAGLAHLSCMQHVLGLREGEHVCIRAGEAEANGGMQPAVNGGAQPAVRHTAMPVHSMQLLPHTCK